MKIEPLKLPLLRIIECDKSHRRVMVECLSGEYWEVRVYVNGIDFLTQDDLSRVGVVVMDLKLPDIDGLKVQDYLTSRGIHLPIIFLCDEPSEGMTARDPKETTKFLFKPLETTKLVEVVHGLMRKQTKAIKLLELKTRLQSLTVRQRQILDLFACGMDCMAIAEYLGLCKGTVQQQKRVVFRKLDISDITEILSLLRELSNEETSS